MCKQITRQEAYDKIIKSYISLMNDKQIIECCLHWIGFEKYDIEYSELMEKLNDIYLYGEVEAKQVLFELLKSSKLYKIIGTTNAYLEYLLKQQYEVTGEIETMEECPCCHYLSISNINVQKHCPICGWSNEVLQHGDILLEIGQERFVQRGHILRWLSNQERQINAIKYVKIGK